jgi:hypothetical protein
MELNVDILEKEKSVNCVTPYKTGLRKSQPCCKPSMYVLLKLLSHLQPEVLCRFVSSRTQPFGLQRDRYQN